MMFCNAVRAARRILTTSPAIALALTGLLGLTATPSQAKTPGKTYCFNGVCHRVNTLNEMSELVGKDQTFKSSFYDDCKRDRYNPCGLTSSGEVFRANDADNAASPIYPNGTVLLVRNPSNGKAAVVRVNNAGPYWGKRKLDVSRGTAEKLGFKKKGVASLDVRVLHAPTKLEAKYKKNRRYEAVPGPIGSFASLDAAQGSIPASIMLAMAPDAKPVATANLKLASADMLPAMDALEVATGDSPADGLKAAARRAFGIEQRMRMTAPFSLTADAGIAPIHRSRQQL
jgi:rare lipoprotein A